MSGAGAKDVGASRIDSLSEEAMAGWLARQGSRITVHRGRYWHETLPGFFRPVNWLARLDASEATSPSWRAWGFRAALRPGAEANGSLPAHIFTDLAGFSEASLGSMQMRNLKKCRKTVALEELTDPETLAAEGYDAVVDTLARTGHARPPSPQAYRASVLREFEPGRLLVLAGRVEGRLGGYFSAYAVDGIAYAHQVYTRTDALKSGINAGLLVEFLLCCRRSGIREVVHGLDTPENPSLVEFKLGYGFPVVQVPTRVSVNPLLGAVARRVFPERYYRITGRR